MNLVEGLHKEIIRNKELSEIYKSTGKPGLFALFEISNEIKRAENALASGDVTEMVRACKVLQENKE